ncbi:MAG: helix-hairpin-helix domain-containing protein [Candidatus Firestonebacteria bacterium]
MKKQIKSSNNLQSVINIGPATEKRLQSIGVATVSQLKKSNPEKIYEKLKKKEGGKLDICVLYQLRGVILNVPWWFCKNSKGEK